MRRDAVWTQIFDKVDELAVALDFEYRILYFNRAYEKAFESVFKRAPRVGQDLRVLVEDYPNELSRVTQWWGRALTGETFVAVLPGGESDVLARSHDYHFFPFVNDEGKRIGSFQLAKNAAFRETAQALQQTRMRVQRLFSSNVIGIVQYNLNGQTMEANEAFLNMLGYSREELLAGKVNWAEITPPEWRWIDDRAIAEIRAKGVATPFQKEYFRKDGSRVQVLVGPANYEDSPSEGVSFILDISEREKARHMLELSEERFRMAAEASGVGFVDWDMDQGELTFAANAHIFLGPRLAVADEGTRTYPSELFFLSIHPKDRARVQQRVEALSLLHPRVIEEFQVIRPDGTTRWIILRAEIRSNVAGKSRRLVGTFLDITERKTLELERNSSLKRASDALKLRDEFLSIASHDLRSPAISMGYQLQRLRKFIGMPKELLTEDLQDKITQGLDSAIHNSRRLIRFLDSLLDLSRLRTDQFELDLREDDLSEIIREVIVTMEPELNEKKIPLEVSLCEDAVALWDRTRVEQALRNLLSNAIKYGLDNTITIALQSEDEAFVLSIQDRGLGIPQRLRDKIFDQFERGVEGKRADSLGLGLYITRAIVHAHGGEIFVEGPPEGGTRFVLRLPKFREVETKTEGA